MFRVHDKNYELHASEKYTTELAQKLAKSMKNLLGFEASCIVWNSKVAKNRDRNNLDPNHMSAANFAISPWNQGIAHFKQAFPNMPLLHLDLHGRTDAHFKTGYPVEFSLAAASLELANKDAVEQFRLVMHQELAQCFACNKLLVAQKPFLLDTMPKMSGVWDKPDCYTMSHQSALQGIMSVQCELPSTLREELMKNDTLLDRFARAIAQMYNKVNMIYV